MLLPRVPSSGDWMWVAVLHPYCWCSSIRRNYRLNGDEKLPRQNCKSRNLLPTLSSGGRASIVAGRKSVAGYLLHESASRRTAFSPAARLPEWEVAVDSFLDVLDYRPRSWMPQFGRVFLRRWISGVEQNQRDDKPNEGQPWTSHHDQPDAHDRLP